MPRASKIDDGDALISCHLRSQVYAFAAITDDYATSRYAYADCYCHYAMPRHYIFAALLLILSDAADMLICHFISSLLPLSLFFIFIADADIRHYFR